jgi:ubiquinone/menaquinone biosynthesis C-methylase UbiE
VRHVVGTTTYDALHRRLQAEGRLGHVLELGCGTGLFTRVVAPVADHVTATDLAEPMLAVARAELAGHANVTFDVVDAESTRLAPGRFDTVLIANVLPFVDARRTLRECARVLRPGGRLLVVDYTFRGLRPLTRARYGLRALRAFGIPPRRRRDPSADEIRRLVTAAGLTVDAVDLVGRGVKAVYVRARKPA